MFVVNIHQLCCCGIVYFPKTSDHTAGGGFFQKLIGHTLDFASCTSFTDSSRTGTQSDGINIFYIKSHHIRVIPFFAASKEDIRFLWFIRIENRMSSKMNKIHISMQRFKFQQRGLIADKKSV